MHVKADLHIHSNHSDGELAPAELVRLCHKLHLQTVALADHDTVSGIPPMQAAANALGLEVIPAIEISAQHDPGTLHILGYFKEYPKNLEKELQQLQQGRQKRLPRMIDKLNQLGMQITADEVLTEAGSGQVGRPHIARVMLSKGYIRSFEEAFNGYLGKGQPAYVDKEKLPCDEAIAMIKRHRGLAVLAHPFSLEMEDHELIAFIEQTPALDGIEIFHSQHTKAQRRLYKRLARQHGLLTTGGTDFHAPNNMRPGQHGIDIERLTQFKERLRNL